MAKHGIRVSDSDTRKDIDNARFNHPYKKIGNGFYEVDIPNFAYECGAPNYKTFLGDIRFTEFVYLEKDTGKGGGWF